MNMKSSIGSIILILTALNLHAEDGQNLWLRGKSTGSVNVVYARTSLTLAIAKQELEQGWQGKDEATVVLTIKKDKSIKGDGFKLTAQRGFRPIQNLEFYMAFMNCCVASKQVSRFGGDFQSLV